MFEILQPHIVLMNPLGVPLLGMQVVSVPVPMYHETYSPGYKASGKGSSIAQSKRAARRKRNKARNK